MTWEGPLFLGSYVKLFTGLLILQVTNSKQSISLDRELERHDQDKGRKRK